MFDPQYYQSFKEKLPEGKYYEYLYTGHLNFQGYSAITTTGTCSHDIEFVNPRDLLWGDETLEVTTIELKSENRIVETGNLAVEYKDTLNNKPSGLATTTATRWCHWAKSTSTEQVHCADTEEVKDLIRKNWKGYLKVPGNKSLNVLVPLIEFKQLNSYEQTVITKGYKNNIIKKYNL